MLNRRNMFVAIMAAGGVSAVTADHAVAMAFDDAAYLSERTDRLRAHEAEVDRLDAERREYRAKNEAEQKIIDGYQARALRAQAFGDTVTLEMPYAHYDIMARQNLIDFIPDGDEPLIVMRPTFMSQRVVVIAA